MPRSTRSKLLVVALALGFWACGNKSTTTSPTSPTTPTTTTETFEGTLNPNGAKTFPFTIQAAGTVTATLTTVSPDASVAIGLALGTWNGTACQIVLANDSATQGAVVIGSVSTAGSLCTRVYDVGNLTDVASFVVTVEHP
jgi:hypothetical protein